MALTNPFHEGEREAQRRAGESAAAAETGRIIGDALPAGAASFISRQSCAVVASRDAAGRLWASVLLGRPGFMNAPDHRTVRFDSARMFADVRDPLWNDIRADPNAGVLVIDLAARRRLRINGKMTRTGADGLELAVREAFPNCPKFIRRRNLIIETNASGPSDCGMTAGTTLGATQKRIIAEADTFFVASAHPERGADASHRGGKAGFVSVAGDATLRIPDYPGNGMFQTFGNLIANPKAGLVFLDFDRRRVLQMTGTASIRWNAAECISETGGTGRWWEFDIAEWIQTELPDGVRWECLDDAASGREERFA
jgi:predicted pyridoxine 5'-phosphate oxidase superfamily flavin-nucleotide-binding protein